MAKRRFQNPTPKLHGKHWTIVVRRDEFVDGKLIRKQVREVIAPAATSKTEAKKIASEKMRSINQGLETLGSATLFKVFVEDVYLKTVLPVASVHHVSRYEGILKKYLLPVFGEKTLRDITMLTAQTYLTGLRQYSLAHASMDKIRDCASAVMAAAKQYGLIISNPFEDLRIPRPKQGKAPKPNITPQQFEAIVALMQEPYATMVYVAVWTGLMISELVALRWKDLLLDDCAIVIDERCSRGDWGAPKTEARNDVLAVSRQVLNRMLALKGQTVRVGGGRGGYQTYQLVKSSGPDDLVFQSVRKGAVMRDNNILVRHIKPAAARVGLGWVNWRCLRTSHATWLKPAGVPVRDAQKQMRHSRASTTLDIYQQTTDEHQRAAVAKLEAFIAANTASTRVN